MAGTVTLDAVVVTSAESGDSANWDDIGAGPGSSQSGDQPVQGSENRARRLDNITDRGASYDSTTGVSLVSAANRHVGFWLNIFQPALLSNLQFALGDASTPFSGNYSTYTMGTPQPFTGGWVKVWLEVNAYSGQTGTGGRGSVRQWGCQISIGDISGTSENFHLDEIVRTNNLNEGLIITAGTGGSPATFADFIAFDEGSARHGFFQTSGAAIRVFSAFRIGNTATEVIFQDSNFVLLYPTPPTITAFGTSNQIPCTSLTWRSITVVLDDVDTDIDWVNGTVLADVYATFPTASRFAAILCSGTSGSFNITGGTYSGIRKIVLTSACAITNASIRNLGWIDMGDGGSINGCTLSAGAWGLHPTGLTSFAAAVNGMSDQTPAFPNEGSSTFDTEVMVYWDTNSDPDGNMDDVFFNREETVVPASTSGSMPQHAIGFDSNTPSSVTLNGHTYDNFFPPYSPANTVVTFDTETGIDGGTEVVTTDVTHGYATGDPVIVEAQGGTETPGLTSGRLYWVRALSTTTLAFYTTEANAIADTSRVNLTASGGGSGESWELYHGRAAIYNATGGALTINVVGGDTPSFRNSNGSSTTIVNSVTVTVTVLDEDLNPIEGALVYVQDIAGAFDDNNQIIREFTNASGIATEAFGFSSPVTVEIRARKLGYEEETTTALLGAGGLAQSIQLSVSATQE